MNSLWRTNSVCLLLMVGIALGCALALPNSSAAAADTQKSLLWHDEQPFNNPSLSHSAPQAISDELNTPLVAGSCGDCVVTEKAEEVASIEVSAESNIFRIVPRTKTSAPEEPWPRPLVWGGMLVLLLLLSRLTQSTK